MFVMALDLSLRSTGVCIAEEYDGGFRTHILKVIKTNKSELPIEEDVLLRGMYLCSELCKLLDEYTVDHLIIEGLSYASKGQATRSLAMLLGIVLSNVPAAFTMVPPKTLKKFATDNGNANKDMMLEAIKLKNIEMYEAIEVVPISKGRSDIVDAYWLAQYFYSFTETKLKQLPAPN